MVSSSVKVLKLGMSYGLEWIIGKGSGLQALQLVTKRVR